MINFFEEEEEMKTRRDEIDRDIIAIMDKAEKNKTKCFNSDATLAGHLGAVINEMIVDLHEVRLKLNDI